MILRDRIVAAIEAVDDWRGVTDPALLADAVIKELDIKEIEAQAWFTLDGHPKPVRKVLFATDWILTGGIENE